MAPSSWTCHGRGKCSHQKSGFMQPPTIMQPRVPLPRTSELFALIGASWKQIARSTYAIRPGCMNPAPTGCIQPDDDTDGRTSNDL